MTTHRVFVTARPSETTIAAVHALLAGAACMAINRGVIAGKIPAEDYERRAAEMGARLLAIITEEAPTDESTARMVASAIQTAGGRAAVVAA